MAGFFKKLADRFRPSPIERLKQSAEAKKKQLERQPRDKPHVQQPEPVQVITRTIDVEPTGGVNTVWGLRHNHSSQLMRIWHTSNNSVTTCDTYSDPFPQWTSAGNSCHGTAASTDTVWELWNNGSTATATITSGNTVSIIRHWVDESERTRPARRETAAQKKKREAEEAKYRAEREAADARYHEEQRAAENRRKEADDRAMQLLTFLLNAEQRSDLQAHKHFFVNAPSGRLYRIDYGISGNVKVIDRQSRRVIERICMHSDGVPAGDVMAMQKMLIETAEVAFRTHANITLEDGTLIRGDPTPLTGEKLAQIIPLRKAA